MVEDHAIEAFLEAFNEVHAAGYSVTGRPDQVNRSTPDVDAYAECKGRNPLAIEHTLLESFEGQYSAGRVYVDYVVPLQQDLDGVFPYNFDLLVPHEALQPGTDWSAMATQLREWFLAHAGEATDGITHFSLPGVPGTFTLKKRPSDLHVVFMSRKVPVGEFDDMLRQRMSDSLNHKYEQLANYRHAGATTALILHSQDISMVNDHILAEAASSVLADEPHPDLDEVWLVWSIGDTTLVCCLVGPEEVRLAALERMRRRILDEN